MMSRLYLLLVTLTFLFTLPTTAQDLPGAWSISPDGRILTAGGENETGFYSQNEVHDVQLEFTQPDWWTVAQVNGSVGTTSVWLHYGVGLTEQFSKTEMFDDGLNNDGAADDGQFGGTIPPLTAGTYGRYYIEAVAANAAAMATYEPKGAEHDVFLYQINNTSSLAGDLVINEFMASNDTTQADQDGEFDDWIELYNNTGEAISLDGFHLTDDAEDLTKWAFPDDSSIAGNGYLIIWADAELDQTGLHADFRLSAGGETLLLVDADGAIVDSITYADQETDISHRRFPNGTGEFQDMMPTFNAENSTTSTRYTPLIGAELTLFPNPTAERLNIRLEQAYKDDLQFRLFAVDGRLLRETILTSGGTRLEIHASGLPDGFYLLSVADGRAVETHKVVVRQ